MAEKKAKSADSTNKSAVKKTSAKAETAKKTAVKKAAAKKAPAKKTSAGKSTVKRGVPNCSGKTLVIVESPAKAKTISKILGSKYEVLASVGHVRDLPRTRMAIDVENNFEPDYVLVRGKGDLVKTLKEASKQASKTLLASDPDREGEAIAWHLANLLDIDPASKCRIRMHEITKNGAEKAVASPDNINLDLVNAQQARRVLDRLVGYELSPLLWRKVKRGLSAGRVQSVALRIVCEREEEIENFQKEEYWNIEVEASADSRKYKLKVVKYQGKEFKIPNKAEADKVKAALKAGQLTVKSFDTKESLRKAPAPYKTSTLQQDVSSRCGFGPRRTMRIAQSLYEGVELPGRGATGLITYMRTDSLRLAPEAVSAARSFIEKTYGKAFLPAKANLYQPDERAQDAHEAIRATDASITPDSIKEYLTPEQYSVYNLIWKRYIASQMSDARITKNTITCADSGYTLQQSGNVVAFEGWGRVYPLSVTAVDLQPAKEGEILSVDKILAEQKFTQPPARYSEAGLIKILEEKGIGRPSTYATIVETLSARNYVEHGEDKKLAPTKLGRTVNSFLLKYFSGIDNVGFTADMENSLDKIDDGVLEWRKLVGTFWKDFKPLLDDVAKNGEPMHLEPEYTGENCPQCGKPLLKRSGRFGEFIACSGYPECKYTANVVKTTGIKCPKCGEGELVRRRAKNGKAAGRFFYACTRYPDCDYVAWKLPQELAAKLAKKKETEDEDVSDM